MSPYSDRKLQDWLDELPGQIESLREEGVNLAVPQTASVEFAGPPDGRDMAQSDLEKLGWRPVRGIGSEPDATVFLYKHEIWAPARLETAIVDCFYTAKNASCVFEGLYVTVVK